MNFEDDDTEKYFTEDEKILFRKLDENSSRQEKLVKMMSVERDEKEFDNLLAAFNRLSQEMNDILTVIGDKIREDLEEIERMRNEENEGENWKKKDD